VKPTVLIATTTNWVPTARLAAALVDAGFRVEALCPSGHPIAKTDTSIITRAYHGLAPLRSLVRAILTAKPSIVIPGDDLAAQHLHDLHAQPELHSSNSPELKTLIETSLGSPESFPVVQSRPAFMRLAQEEGIRVPRTGIIRSKEELRKWVKDAGLPVVLKADGTSGGDGVRVVRTIADAEAAFEKLRSPVLLARAVKHALVDGDWTLMEPSVRRQRPSVSAQAFVEGREATSTVTCWKGSVLASLHFEVLRKSSGTGHATVVRQIDNAEISKAVEMAVRRLGLSGMCGFDFMIESATGCAYLIEINPRATQVGHLTLGAGHDLPAALYSAVSGQPVRAAPAVTENCTIALFPHEWARDPKSEFVRTGYHDVPWDKPELVHTCIHRSRKQSAWYQRDAKHDAELSRGAVEVRSKSRTATVDCAD
jgi:hypothetical protein